MIQFNLKFPSPRVHYNLTVSSQLRKQVRLLPPPHEASWTDCISPMFGRSAAFTVKPSMAAALTFCIFFFFFLLALAPPSPAPPPDVGVVASLSCLDASSLREMLDVLSLVFDFFD